MPIAHINGVNLNYVQMEPQHGHGYEDIVMVHGLATNMAFWYFQYAPVFSKNYRVTVFDLRGHGRSEMTASGYTPHNLAVDLEQLLDYLKIEKAHFVAHSFGGVVSLNLACLNPHRIASLVLADTHISAVRQSQNQKTWGFGREIQPLLDKYGLDLHVDDPYFGYRLLTRVAQMKSKNEAVPEALAELISPLIGKQGNRTATQWLKLMDSTHAEQELMGDDHLTLEKLQKFNFPILAMYGDNSQAKLTGKQLLDVWPHAEFRRVRDAGHFFPATRPDEVITNCTRFWGGDLAKIRKARQGESEINFFRSDRIYSAEGAWYCLTRESTKIGPFAEQDEGKEFLSTYISAMAAG